MNDLIKRADAIKAIEDLPNAYNGWSDAYDKAYIIGTLEDIPSAEPTIEIDAHQLAKLLREGWTIHSEPKQGEWIFQECTDESYGRAYECSICGVAVVGNHHNFCPNCGARMKGADDDPI